MTLFLDHQQRISLITLLGAQKGTLGELRMLWKMQDRIELTEAEKVAINYRLVFQNGMEYNGWDRDKKLEPRAFDFTEGEAQRLSKLIEEWPHFTAFDRIWLESVLEQLAIPETSQPSRN